MTEGDYLEAVLWYYNAVYEAPAILNVHCGGDWALERLVLCYEKLGNYEQAEAFRKQKEEWGV